MRPQRLWEYGGSTPLWYFGRSPFLVDRSKESRSATIPKLRQAGALPKSGDFGSAVARHRFGTLGGALFLSIGLKKVAPRRFQSSVKPEHSQRRGDFGSAVARHRFGTLGEALFLSIGLKKVAPRRFQSSVQPEHSLSPWGTAFSRKGCVSRENMVRSFNSQVCFRPGKGCSIMPIGIRPINDFAFKKTFGSPENKMALISLLNAILNLPTPIVDVTIENPYNLQDFKEDKLSILDIRAVDQSGAIYDVEMQLSIFSGLIQRIVFYGCEIYTDQLRSGDDYSLLKPAYSICLLDGTLWHDSKNESPPCLPIYRS
jgi:hypothetical protein